MDNAVAIYYRDSLCITKSTRIESLFFWIYSPVILTISTVIRSWTGTIFPFVDILVIYFMTGLSIIQKYYRH